MLNEENKVSEKQKRTSTFLLVTQVLVLESFISLWKSLKKIMSVFKFYMVFGILPNRKQISFDQQLQFSKQIIGIYLILAVFKIVLLELSDDSLNSSNFFQNIAELFIVIIYYLGIIIFCLMGRIIAFI